MSNHHTLFDQLNIVAADLDATLDFYRRLGLEIPDDAVWRTASGAHHAQVKVPGGADLEFDSEALARQYNRGTSTEPRATSRNVIGLRVPNRDDVDTLYRALTAAGAPSRQPPYDTFWGSRYAIIADPDGNQVGLMSPPDPAKRSAPPEI